MLVTVETTLVDVDAGTMPVAVWVEFFLSGFKSLLELPTHTRLAEVTFGHSRLNETLTHELLSVLRLASRVKPTTRNCG